MTSTMWVWTSKIKSFRSRGRFTFSLIISRYFKLPWKWATSVKTEIAETPLSA